MRGFDGMPGVAEPGPKYDGGDCATGARDEVAGNMNSENWVGSRRSWPMKKGFVLGERRCGDCFLGGFVQGLCGCMWCGVERGGTYKYVAA
jgi:hypothetical protein